MRDKIVVFGTGEYGRKTVEFIGFLADRNQICFCQTKKTEEKVIGIPVLSISELMDDYDDIRLVLIAIKNKNESDSIRTLLSSVFLDCIPVIEIGNLIRENDDIISIDSSKKCFCDLCNSYIDSFQPGSIVDNIDLFKKHHVIGAGYRKNMYCPVCNGDDRSRWVLYCLSKYSGIFKEKCSVLHFAPENKIEAKIRANKECDYYSGDIILNRAMHYVDITRIQFKDNYFDYIILNHVMEHIENEGDAVKEIIRVLKPDGMIIMSFPICTDMVTQENKNRNLSENERLLLYGQTDHFRLYGNDFRNRFEDYGLSIEVFSPQDKLSNSDIEKYGLICDDTLLFCRIRN